MKFRKKPGTVEAFQYDGDLIDAEGHYYVPEWAARAYEMKILFYRTKDTSEASPMELFLCTQMDCRHVSVGDYLICNEDGSLAVCSAKDFEKDYEVVTVPDDSSGSRADPEHEDKSHGQMQNYIGVKIVKAEPEEKDGRPGYRVKYPDDYVSWSPKDVFEKAYRILDCEDFINSEG